MIVLGNQEAVFTQTKAETLQYDQDEGPKVVEFGLKQSVLALLWLQRRKVVLSSVLSAMHSVNLLRNQKYRGFLPLAAL